MAKTLKFISAIILFIFLFLTTKEIASYPIKTFARCKSNNDCFKLLAIQGCLECMNGRCHVVRKKCQM
ncbi:unnamed protein product [Trifolium pratense]|uniref:Uncharacterized protein n=1 Tax=Trifolium pratense TaxID=57577 RepID=A0ACB0LCL7_TRIPR|nr:unnamed protein product [Trifolium pratense]